MPDADAVRVLDHRHLLDALALLRRDPITNVFAEARLRGGGWSAGRSGAQVWGYFSHRRLASLCYAGTNLVLAEAAPQAVRCFAQHARRASRHCSSIMGPAEPTAEFWHLIEPMWGPARDIRPCQPLLAIRALSPTVAADPAVRLVRPDELDVVLPACVAMFSEEVGVPPMTGDTDFRYRNQVAELIRAGRSFARIEDGRVLFKAEIGSVTPEACQIDGVWVPADLRGRGLSPGGVAAVVAHALRSIAPAVCLYVNADNTPARATYQRVGFAEAGAFMSVLF